MDLRSAGRTRRWQLTIASVAALSLFIALVAGSSLRTWFAAAELPEPAAWTHASQRVPSHSGQLELHTAVRLYSPVSTVTNKKPFRNVWMTHDRPASWTHLSSELGWLALPTSFAAPVFHPGAVLVPIFASAPVNRDRSTDLCILRR